MSIKQLNERLDKILKNLTEQDRLQDLEIKEDKIVAVGIYCEDLPKEQAPSNKHYDYNINVIYFQFKLKE